MENDCKQNKKCIRQLKAYQNQKNIHENLIN